MSNEQKKARVPRTPKIWEALLSFAVLIGVMSVGIAVFGVDPHIPMIIGTAFAAIMALWLGFDWKYIEKSMFDGIYQALQAVIILAVIGVLIGVWLVAGVVPTMIYYGLQIITPSLFLVASLITCSITSLATGTSWGTCGTIGIALMGVASGLGIPLPMAAGAVISGAYFGDKMSPLSDTTNLAPAMAGTDVFTHVKFMIRSTLPVYIIVIVIYLVLGFRFAKDNIDMSNLAIITAGIRDSFTISPVLLIPPLVVILSIAFKMPAIPGIFLGIVSGGILGAIVQGNNFGLLLSSAYGGHISETGIEAIDELLTAGGLENMMYSISLTILAMTFGGIMEKTGQLEVIVQQLIKFARGTTSLVGLTLLTCFGSNATMPEQYISLVVPGRMYNATYRKRGLHPKMLSNALEASGTVTSALIPWNTCGVFLTGVLGVSTLQYAPWAFFNYLMPIAVLIMTAFGLLTVKISDDPGTVIAVDDISTDAVNAGAEVVAKA
ncbi:Na+/H+ antiporter NhaC [Treponema primitia]|uniref:Na+/H+ antiporter NhaC n=1 Tax=Treponema primitia TaxID=88058 RepID=UPI0002554DD4|nr:Na+/H+ antiporter NhaC [Treponema primitia]